MIRGKNVKATVTDVAEGFTAVNPILLKPLDAETIKELYREVSKKQGEIRAEKFPAHDMQSIRWRNLRLQRLHTAAMVIRNFAKMRKIPLI